MEFEYDVLSVILEKDFVKGAKSLVLPNTFAAAIGDSLPSNLWPHVHTDTRLTEDFVNKNSRSCAVEAFFALSVPYFVCGDGELKEIFGLGGWDEFYRRFPDSNGLVSISRVGFNSQMTQALACVGIQSHWLMGHGSYYLLEKECDEWKIKLSARAWVS